MAYLRTHTDYDLERMEELQRVAGKTFAKQQTKVKRVSAFSWGIGFTVAGVFVLLAHNNAFLTLLFCGIGLLRLANGIFFYQWAAWKAYQALGKNKEGNDYIFEKTEILATRGKEGGRYAYTDCKQLLETQRNFYFILTNGQGLMLDKSRVKGGTVDDLRRLLEERSGQTVTRVDL